MRPSTIGNAVRAARNASTAAVGRRAGARWRVDRAARRGAHRRDGLTSRRPTSAAAGALDGVEPSRVASARAASSPVEPRHARARGQREARRGREAARQQRDALAIVEPQAELRVRAGRRRRGARPRPASSTSAAPGPCGGESWKSTTRSLSAIAPAAPREHGLAAGELGDVEQPQAVEQRRRRGRRRSRSPRSRSTMLGDLARGARAIAGALAAGASARRTRRAIARAALEVHRDRGRGSRSIDVARLVVERCRRGAARRSIDVLRVERVLEADAVEVLPVRAGAPAARGGRRASSGSLAEDLLARARGARRLTRAAAEVLVELARRRPRAPASPAVIGATGPVDAELARRASPSVGVEPLRRRGGRRRASSPVTRARTFTVWPTTSSMRAQRRRSRGASCAPRRSPCSRPRPAASACPAAGGGRR